MLCNTSLSFVSLFCCLVFLLKLTPLNPSFYYGNHAFNIHSSCIDIMPEGLYQCLICNVRLSHLFFNGIWSNAPISSFYAFFLFLLNHMLCLLVCNGGLYGINCLIEGNENCVSCFGLLFAA